MAKSFFSWQWADGWAWGDGWQWCSISGKMASYLPSKQPVYNAEFPPSLFSSYVWTTGWQWMEGWKWYDRDLYVPVESFSESIDTEYKIVETEDDEEERVAVSEPFFMVTLDFPHLRKTQVALLYDFYFNEEKANGKVNTFKWTHPIDNCTYVVRFDTDLESSLKRGFYADGFSIDLRVLGWNKLNLN